ncbi:MAG: hypothetical protein OEY01_05100 [Desulfobulbaceae bacterium]|nr:hypothetical protein [Desulfobulbaceae bacterium]
MKWLITAVAVTLFACTAAMAAPISTFQQTVADEGMDKAVVAALASGLTVNDIMVEALAIEGINPISIMTALFDACAALSDVTDSAAKNNVSAQIIATVSELFITRNRTCGEEDTQAFTPAQRRLGPMPTVPGGDSHDPYASPSS